MTEKEILEKIKLSAESLEVPESLSPGNILEKCRKLEQEKAGGGEKERKKFPVKYRAAVGLSAAAVFIICCISLKEMGGIDRDKTSAGGMAEESAAVTTDAAAPADGATEGGAIEEAETESADAGDAPVIRKNAGELYTLADGYDAVYARLEEIKAVQQNDMDRGYMADDGFSGMLEDRVMTSGIAELEEKQEASASKADRYSETNVQTLGIDESDVVKTDGEYIYLLRGSSVSIVSAGEKEMKQVGEIEADTEGGAADACAMYVDGDILVLAVQESLTSLKEKEAGEEADFAMKYMDTDMVTSVLTYDISNKENPVPVGKMTQDGSYVTSRKDGSILYLFTSKYLLEDYGSDDVIPEVNARKIAEDCIYMGDQGERALVVSSLSVNRPETVRDSVMILDSGSEIYMGEDSLYLYRGNYQSGSEVTEIAKFSMTGGYLSGEAAASVRGSVRDTFAIHEKENKLRVLTTDTSGGDWENCLFLLDENLKVTGKLMHIAVGESIYAARYLGDMAYFITYRNTDPLFAVDLSDDKEPKLVGELEITGFSEYLHFWGEDKLLGLGYETDPKTGEQKGLKLVMFDMSDPAALKTLGSRVLEETSYSPALYNYKAVLADPEENLVGFVTEYYRNGTKRKYELYRWNGNRFEKLLSEELKDGYGNENYRGIYAGDRFYIAHPEVVRYYDREDYGLKQKLELE